MVKRKFKYRTGEATSLISRKQALSKLQITLNDFRRLCIIKGIYPQEPKNKKRAGKGSTVPKVYYHLKDIQFLAHEPVLQKMRDLKAFFKKIKTAKGKGDMEKVQRLRKNKPSATYDHIIKERYPSFEDALRDLDDCLCLCFLFARLPKERGVSLEVINLSRRLTVQFLLYVMEAKALRRAFISIKGYYFEAELFGQSVVWCVPHQLGLPNAPDVDFRVLKTFVEFYTTLLGFANFRLYQSLGLVYPPAIATPELSFDPDLCLSMEWLRETLAVLNQPLKRRFEEESPQLDSFGEESEEILAADKKKNLFQGLRFFLGRETPREILTLVIRSCSGVVSWDASSGPGHLYSEDDSSITHQVMDRPLGNLRRPGRSYVQPQWLFDCLNSGNLLPSASYTPGQPPPPHLSPFTTDRLPDTSTTALIRPSEPEKKQEFKETATPVSKGKVQRAPEPERASNEQRKLREMMLPKKHRELYKKMVHSRKRAAKEDKQLQAKRARLQKEKAAVS